MSIPKQYVNLLDSEVNRIKRLIASNGNTNVWADEFNIMAVELGYPPMEKLWLKEWFDNALKFRDNRRIKDFDFWMHALEMTDEEKVEMKLRFGDRHAANF